MMVGFDKSKQKGQLQGSLAKDITSRLGRDLQRNGNETLPASNPLPLLDSIRPPVERNPQNTL